MAKIPTYQQTYLPDVNVSRAGEIKGEAITKVGKAITGLGFQLKKAQAIQEAKQKELQRQKDNSLVSAAAMELQKKEYNIRNDLAKSQLDPLAMPDSFNTSYDMEVRKMTKRMEKAGLSAEGFQALKLKTEQIKLSGYKNAMSMSDKMFAQEVANNYEGIKEDLGVLSYRGRDLVDGYNDVDEFLEANKSAFPKDAYEKMQRDGYNAVAYNYGVGQIERNPFTGKKILNSGILDDNLTADQIYRLNARADSEMQAIMRQREKEKIKESLAFDPMKTLDREDKKEVEAYNEWFDETGITEMITSDDWTDVTRGMDQLEMIVAKHQQLPKRVEKLLRSGIYGENPAAESIIIGLKNNPEVRQLIFNKLNEKDLGWAQTKYDLRQLGFDKEQIDEYEKNWVRPTNSLRQEEIKNQINDTIKELDFEALSTKTVNEIIEESELYTWKPSQENQISFAKDLDISPNVMRKVEDIRTPENFLIDYKLKLEKYLQATGGDLERAQRLTKENIQANYGVTKFNGGNVLMEYAPEKVIGVRDPALSEIEPDWMKKQLEMQLSDFRRKVLTDPEDKFDVDENIILVTDNITRVSVKQEKPSWLILKVEEDEDEEYLDVILNENMQPLRFTPSSLEYRKMLSDKRKKEIDEKYKEARIVAEERRQAKLQYEKIFGLTGEQ